MNEIKRQVVRGLYKEAGIASIIKGLKDAAIKTKDFAVDQYKKNPRLYNDAGGALAMMGLGKAKDALQGKETSLLDYLTYGGVGVTAAELAQWGAGKYKKLTDTQSKLDAANTNLAAANTNLAAANADNSNLRERLNTANVAIDKLKNELDTANNQTKQIAKLKNELQKRYEELEVQRNTESGTAAEELDKLNKEINQLTQKNQTLTKQYAGRPKEAIESAKKEGYKQAVTAGIKRQADSQKLEEQKKDNEKNRTSDVSAAAASGFVKKLMTLGDYWAK